MTKKTSIRMSGLGGQGVVTAAHILGSAATRDGLVSTVTPFFGAEKRLAPAESYVRVSPSRIYERGEILFPNVIMIFHPHVISLGKCYTMPFFAGLQPSGLMLVNGDSAPELSQDEREALKRLDAKLYYFPATKLALEVGGTDLATNIAMLGGLLAITHIVSWQGITDALAERFGGGKFVASATTAALDDALKSKYEKVSQLLEQNMAVMQAVGPTIKEFTF
ncbi:MAG: NADH-dependent phenylglyoxylate dehydrogenase subunit gamma [Firmicutes bacterium]|nr:NADH-dependent phenylglyoxylate dehydrogenase subunit gamma [Bacillota bacterium]